MASDRRRRNLSWPHDEQVGTVNLFRARARADPVPRSLLRHGYPLTSEHESRRRRESRRKDHRWRGDLHLDHVQGIVPLACGSEHLTEQFAGGFAPNFV
jgi:hypothetical protein